MPTMTKGTSKALGKSTSKVEKCPPTPKIILLRIFRASCVKELFGKVSFPKDTRFLGENHPIPVEPDPSIAVCFMCVLLGVFSAPKRWAVRWVVVVAGLTNGGWSCTGTRFDFQLLEPVWRGCDWGKPVQCFWSAKTTALTSLPSWVLWCNEVC